MELENTPNKFRVGYYEGEFVPSGEENREGHIEITHDSMAEPTVIDVEEVFDLHNLVSLLMLRRGAEAGDTEAADKLESLAEGLEALIEDE